MQDSPWSPRAVGDVCRGRKCRRNADANPCVPRARICTSQEIPRASCPLPILLSQAPVRLLQDNHISDPLFMQPGDQNVVELCAEPSHIISEDTQTRASTLQCRHQSAGIVSGRRLAQTRLYAQRAGFSPNSAVPSASMLPRSCAGPSKGSLPGPAVGDT